MVEGYEAETTTIRSFMGARRLPDVTLVADQKAIGGAGVGRAEGNATYPDGTPITAQFGIDAYHRLLPIEKSFRMSKPIYHHQRDSIGAALAVRRGPHAAEREERT